MGRLPGHPSYTGQDVFFPTSLDIGQLPFRLQLLPNAGDAPKFLRDAVFGFLVNVAHLNLRINESEKNYSILIHTSGKRADHSTDYKDVVKTFNTLNDSSDEHFEKYYQQIWQLAKERHEGEEDEISEYIFHNRNRHTIVVMNSDTDKNAVDYTSATDPSTLFTIVIGGNIVSRGVTFSRLLSMFFTRDVKHRIQQDTYIQRARMFGTRGNYLQSFELAIPENLYVDWHKCFVFHRLSLESIRSGHGSPIWIEDTRVAAVASGSIDKTTVSFDSGEMSFDIFDFNPGAISQIVDGPGTRVSKLRQLSAFLGNDRLPPYVIDYVEHFSPKGDESIVIHPPRTIEHMGDANQERIERVKGFIGGNDIKKFPEAMHHFIVLYNGKQKARVFYKYQGNVKFLKNLKAKANAQGV